MSQKKPPPPWRPDDDSRMTPELARKMVAALAASELSIVDFARLHGIGKQRLFYWRQRLVELDAPQESPSRSRHSSQSQKFAPVIAKESEPSESSRPLGTPMQTLEATLPTGSRVVVHGQWDASSMRTWLAAIEGARC